MKITTAKELQSKFKAGLQIVGENIEGELEWMGTVAQWDNDSHDCHHSQFGEDGCNCDRHLNY